MSEEKRDGLEEIEIAVKNLSIQEDHLGEKQDSKADDHLGKKQDSKADDSEDKCGETSAAVGAKVVADDDDDDDDGYKTPTSEEHKIPVITECPPAPRITRRPSMTKLSATALARVRHRRLLFDNTVKNIHVQENSNR
ncbi:hypothetical protein ACH5RR_006170 [Cinchona calisaya]|uniref:Uncharacterized protein n=1 Tax=Cinchona calisaya TaxID=153742 RepID=A0ABD3ANA6_9GENT